MSEVAWVLIAVLVLVVVGVAAWSMSRRRRSAHLKEHFGPEYERTVGELGQQRAAEAELVAREKKRKKLDIVDLSPEARHEHTATWQMVQAEFVDAPSDAVGRAERLVTRVMRERGYPIDDFDHRAADISVDYPDIVDNYRRAHAIYQSLHDGIIETEAARQAFVYYRALFNRLLGPIPRSRPRPSTMTNGGRNMTTHDMQPTETPLETVNATAYSGEQVLFADGELTDYHSRWNAVQSAFVDDPRDCVQKADGPVADVVDRLTSGFAQARSGLEEQWSRGEQVSTEDLRIALQRYRDFFDRLLAV